MGVNGDVTNLAVRCGNVVVEGADLVLFAQLLADVLTATVTENADSLLNGVVS